MSPGRTLPGILQIDVPRQMVAEMDAGRNLWQADQTSGMQ